MYVLTLFFALFRNALKATMIFQALLAVIVACYGFLTDNPVNLQQWFSLEYVWYFVMFGVNVSVIFALVMILLRGLFSPLIMVVATLIYCTLAKYLTGSLLFFVPLEKNGVIIGIGMYLYLLTYFSALMEDDLYTAIKYRTRDDDDL